MTLNLAKYPFNIPLNELTMQSNGKCGKQHTQIYLNTKVPNLEKEINGALKHGKKRKWKCMAGHEHAFCLVDPII